MYDYHCAKCGGLVPEPMKAYGYAGQYCYCEVPTPPTEEIQTRDSACEYWYQKGKEEAIEECMKVVSGMDTLVEDTEFAGDSMVWVGKYEAVEKLRNLKNKV